jgi:hypothetical protein
MKLASIIIFISLSANLFANEYSFRKYAHVKKFYSEITVEAIKICKERKLPPAAVLAIAGLESGYGSGYVSQITGNILSLGAFRGDKELPALYLPYSKSKNKVLFDPGVIKKYSKDDLIYKKRDKSYKHDYRPKPYAGTIKNLEFLKYNKEARSQARKNCLNDFSTRWINKSSNIKAFSASRIWLNARKDELYDLKTSIGFIERIGGIPNSFNYRKTWPKKVKLLMKKVGLVALVNDMDQNKMNFNEAWEKNN